ncbi:hypothetical protein [Cytobacillus sp. IB215665]|uniref:hypothetical protein n=1 Tax=Cytobacillus sp. IB215665 TaxID=3097357 RepID=UPI002A14CAA9|nr:hypothetical protein [Cytobacillus sp. IB215665]MDX8366967.1 hypothetical protein [Cytobacillus sp. IB215665]
MRGLAKHLTEAEKEHVDRLTEKMKNALTEEEVQYFENKIHDLLDEVEKRVTNQDMQKAIEEQAATIA